MIIFSVTHFPTYEIIIVDCCRDLGVEHSHCRYCFGSWRSVFVAAMVEAECEQPVVTYARISSGEDASEGEEQHEVVVDHVDVPSAVVAYVDSVVVDEQRVDDVRSVEGQMTGSCVGVPLVDVALVEAYGWVVVDEQRVGDVVEQVVVDDGESSVEERTIASADDGAWVVEEVAYGWVVVGGTTGWGCC